MAVAGCIAELQRVPMFQRIEPRVLAGLEQSAFIRRLARGQVLFVDGEPAEHLFVVRTGAIKVQLTSARGVDLLLALLGPGKSLGEVTIVDRGPRSASATAAADTTLLAVPAQAVRTVLNDNPSALWAVAEALAANVRRLTERSADMVFLDLPRRLAKLLLDSATVGRDGVAAFPLLVTQADLAAMIGVSRQSLNKAMSGFAGRGWIEQTTHAVRLVDVAALEKFVLT